MKKNIKTTVIIINYMSLILSCISYAGEGKIEQQKEKRKPIPTIILSEIPSFQTNKQLNTPKKTLLELCKANDTVAFEKLYQEIAAEGIQYNNAYMREDDAGNMPLHIACINNNVRMVEILTPHTYEINKQNKKKETPLHIACRSRKKEKIKMVKLLCQSGRLDHSVQDQTTSTALHIVCMQKNAILTKMILTTMYDISEKRMCLSLQNEEGSTALNTACMFKNIESVKLLLAEPWINLNKAQLDGSTPLHNAILLRCYPIIQLLLAHNMVNPNQQDKISNTPLHLACENNDVAAVTFLLMHKKINPFIKNNDKLKPHHIARQLNNQTIIKLFHDYKAQLKALA